MRDQLPPALRDMPLAGRHGPARPPPRRAHAGADQNFLYDPATEEIRRLDDRELFRQIPISCRICRIYAQDANHNPELAAAMDRLVRTGDADDATNM